MRNKIQYISMQDIPQLKTKLQQKKELFIVEIDGKQCVHLIDYLNEMSECLQFPIKAKGLDGYNDWMRDLSWIKAQQIVILISNYRDFLREDIPSKEAVIKDFNQLILPWWESETNDFVSDGEVKEMTIYIAS